MTRDRKDTIKDPDSLADFIEDPRTAARMRRPSDAGPAFNPDNVQNFVAAFDATIACHAVRKALFENLPPTDGQPDIMRMFDALTDWEKANALFKIKRVVTEWIAAEGLVLAAIARKH